MKWDLTYHYKNKEDYQKEFNEAQAMIAEFEKYQGKLNTYEGFLNFCLLEKKFIEKAYRLYQYSSLKSDLNKKNVENASEIAKCRMLLYAFSEATSFELPEVISIGSDKIMGFIGRDPRLAEFKFEFEKIFRNADHILDEKSEKLLTLFGPLESSGSELYSALAVGDGKSVEVELSNSKKVVVTQSNYRSLIADSQDAEDRRKIFEAIFNNYEEHKNIFATIYNTVLLADKAEAKSRGYKNSLEAHLYGNNIPLEVYYNLVEVAGTYNESLKKYLKIRQEYLKLPVIHTYDRFIELASSNKKYTYEEAKELFFSSLKEFPADFQAKAHEVLKEGFVDVYEGEGKRTGAYSSSMPNMHPFILLNYDGTLDSVFTVAHESGHSMHSMYAAESQPTMLQDYTIFVAEIASTFNEHALLDYFLKLPGVTKDEKIMVIQKAIDNIVGTFYRQTLFAEYELKAHELIENDQPITHEVLSNIMIELYKKYYDIDITAEKVKQYVWAYIPHLFYTPFYVYQYATSFAASFKLYKDVNEHKEGAMERYTNLLRSGGSKYPVEQAKEAGVDFMKKETFMAVVERMNELVDKLEELLK
ncbi:MAG: oligoendopeptidase F [Bacilli bacterium]|nr:oligoendopeptidase F [Bacilli bacterium]MDD7314212.1 oligoendopeptidase F [Bacilli bacterium]MDY4015930.1 oligoendopeptidase F [Bacilli bacterium]